MSDPVRSPTPQGCPACAEIARRVLRAAGDTDVLPAGLTRARLAEVTELQAHFSRAERVRVDQYLAERKRDREQAEEQRRRHAQADLEQQRRAIADRT